MEGLIGAMKIVSSQLSIGPDRSPASSTPRVVPTIATHDGAFHWDDCLAVWLLRQHPDYLTATIIRTRCQELLNEADVVVDVGGIYDPTNNRFDHHQREFRVFFSPEYQEERMSAAGLVYHHFGREVLRHLFPQVSASRDFEWLYHYIYQYYIRVVDAIDNGRGPLVVPTGQPTPTCLWTDPTSMSCRIERIYRIAGEEGFKTAYKMAGQDLLEWIQYTLHSVVPARRVLVDAFHKAGTRPYLVLSERCDYDPLLHDLEREFGQHFLYVIYPDGNGGTDEAPARIKAVPISRDSFVSRRPLPEAWRGLREDALEKIPGAEGITFVHHTGFTCGTRDLSTAIRVVEALCTE
ncbi:MYG1 protein [Giardia muris]|uniref:MYG1 protein n=1 Tax=Giardia muris TaxID=5742 RepID=A0A4Z1T1R1_GIAMU|nr:MYG1 protein [Giardia muris]|eukprot:TNJ26897.1 MYG1 protein [Giardia muris]